MVAGAYYCHYYLTRLFWIKNPQFGKYIEEKQRPEWKEKYINYKLLKDLIKASAQAEIAISEPPPSLRPTSLSVVRNARARDAAEEQFFRALEDEVLKIGRFTAEVVSTLRRRTEALQENVQKAESLPLEEREHLLYEAKQVADEFLQLEKYVNLNYMGFHKALKKHDKLLPHSPCRQFYIAHLHNQPWVQGNYSDLMVILSNVFSQLRGDTLAAAQGGTAQAFNRSTTKYWVRTSDVSTVKRIIIENMPVFVFNEENYTGDAQLVNSVYFDNDSCELYHGRLDKKPNALAIRIRWYGPNDPQLCFIERKTHRESWKGEKSVKERFTLPEHKIVPFLEAEYTAEQFRDDLIAKGKKEDDAIKAASLFEEIQSTIDAKQLKPFVRTQYMRSAFQMGHDRSVSFTLDTNLVMLKENPEGYPTCSISGRWYRDPTLPIHRTEITRFPHAVLEIKLALPEGEQPPEWVRDLMESGLITMVFKFSKFIHGTAVLFPEMVQAVPYWIDDESVRDSIRASAPTTRPVEPTARDAIADTLQENKPRVRGIGSDDDDPLHPLLGTTATLQLMPAPGGAGESRPTPRVTFLSSVLGGLGKQPVLMRLEPKTFLASERTFLSWLHMAITISAIASALLAFSAGSHKRDTPMHYISKNLVEFIALLLLPLSIFIIGYASLVFVWRSYKIAQKEPHYIDDRRGPFLLAGMVCSALTAIFLVSLIDLWDSFEDPDPNRVAFGQRLLSFHTRPMQMATHS